jgi:hypothetical protein
LQGETQARQSVGDGPHDDARRRLPDPGARYVRATPIT